MLGETEEYEPLSRAAYYHAMREVLSPALSKGEGDETKKDSI
jgi:thymidine kinase